MARPTIRSVAPAAALLLLTVVAALRTNGVGDYVAKLADDNPRPAIDAILSGHVATATHLLPAMGLVSVVIRLPFAAFAGSGELSAYRLGIIACLLPLAALAYLLDARAARTGAGIAGRVLRMAVLLGTPTLAMGLHAGHPEQALMGALCVAAVLVAQAGRPVWAGVVLGLALGTKQDAVVAIVPVLLALGAPGTALLSRDRLVAAGVAASVAVLCMAPVVLVDLDHYRLMAGHLAHTARSYPQSLWWPVSSHTTIHVGAGGVDPITVFTSRLPFGLDRGIATALAALASGLLLLSRPVRQGRVDPLALLTCTLVLRTALDPMNIAYYTAPAIFALVAWETLRSPRAVPILSLGASALSYVGWHYAPGAEFEQFGLWFVAIMPLVLLPFVRQEANAPVGFVLRRPRAGRTPLNFSG